MKTVGPVELIAVAFPGEDLPEHADVALRTVELSGDVRVVDALVVAKDRAGRVGTAPAREVPALARIAAEFGLPDPAGPGPFGKAVGPAEVHAVARRLFPGTVAVALLVEHVWARETEEAVRELGGTMLTALPVAPARVPA
jgi:Family of unknown function (DUF6325)